MIFELLHAPFPDGYGEAILSLDACKGHLRVDGDDEDELIKALRDASIDFIERYCGVKLMETAGIVWTAARFPAGCAGALTLSMSPVRAITGVTWLSQSGQPVTGVPADFRITPRGDVLPVIGGQWPAAVGGDVAIEFTAGYDAGQAPPSLLSAVRLFLGHLYKNREAVVDRGDAGEVPFGVRQICSPFRRVVI